MREETCEQLEFLHSKAKPKLAQDFCAEKTAQKTTTSIWLRVKPWPFYRLRGHDFHHSVELVICRLATIHDVKGCTTLPSLSSVRCFLTNPSICSLEGLGPRKISCYNLPFLLPSLQFVQLLLARERPSQPDDGGRYFIKQGDGTVDGGVCFFSKDISPSNHQKLMNDSLTFQKHTFGVQKFALFCFLVVENWDLTSTRKNWSTTNLVDLAQKGTNAPKATWVFLIEMG